MLGFQGLGPGERGLGRGESRGRCGEGDAEVFVDVGGRGGEGGRSADYEPAGEGCCWVWKGADERVCER